MSIVFSCLQQGQLSRANRAAACISSGKNISAKSVHRWGKPGTIDPPEKLARGQLPMATTTAPLLIRTEKDAADCGAAVAVVD